MKKSISAYELTPGRDLVHLCYISGIVKRTLEANPGWFLIHVEWNPRHKWLMMPPRTFKAWADKQDVDIEYL